MDLPYPLAGEVGDVRLTLEKGQGHRSTHGLSDAVFLPEPPERACRAREDEYLHRPSSPILERCVRAPLARTLGGVEDGKTGQRDSQVASGKWRLEDRIENALHIVAALLEHDEAYLPIFLRLEAELDKAAARQSALSRARARLMEPRY